MGKSDDLKSIENIVIKIQKLDKQIEVLSIRLKNALGINKNNSSNFNQQSGMYWKSVAYGDSLIRLRLFLKQNFNYIEPMGLLAVTRYLFELTVWLKLMQIDEKYGYVYHYELIKTKLKYYKNLQEHLIREITFLRDMDTEEKQLSEQRLSEAKLSQEALISDSELLQQNLLLQISIVDSVAQEIDNKASRRFSIYGEQAQTNGYGLQAHLVETKKLPEIEQSISEIEIEKLNFENNISADIELSTGYTWKWRDRDKTTWNWSNKAQEVDMKNDYDFIYRYTSTLLHATPVSLTTEQKNLETDEVKIFLKYIHIRLLDIIDMAEQLVRIYENKT
jgi:hypothetical protein